MPEAFFYFSDKLAPRARQLHRIGAAVAAVGCCLLSTLTFSTWLGAASGAGGRLAAAGRLLCSLTALAVAVGRIDSQCLIGIGMLVIADLRVSSNPCLGTCLFAEIGHRSVFSYSLFNVSSSC